MKISLTPALDKFVAEKVKAGDYLDADEVIRDSLRRWREQEELLRIPSEWLEHEIEEGLESPDLVPSRTFWTDLRDELHRERGKALRRR
jgi:putative addiction module CopG family antidote